MSYKGNRSQAQTPTGASVCTKKGASKTEAVIREFYSLESANNFASKMSTAGFIVKIGKVE